MREESNLVQKLNDEVLHLENENEVIREQLAEILDGKAVSAFKDGQHHDEVPEVCYSLLARGVSARDVESIIGTVLKKLGGMDIGRLPKKV